MISRTGLTSAVTEDFRPLPFPFADERRDPMRHVGRAHPLSSRRIDYHVGPPERLARGSGRASGTEPDDRGCAIREPCSTTSIMSCWPSARTTSAQIRLVAAPDTSFVSILSNS
jgi:hypothetical protein